MKPQPKNGPINKKLNSAILLRDYKKKKTKKKPPKKTKQNKCIDVI